MCLTRRLPALLFCLALLPLYGQPAATKPFSLTWTPLNNPSKASLRGIAVVDAKTAWISGSGGFFARTSDGGNSWMPGQVPGADSLDFRDIQAWDARRALLMAAGPGDGSRIYLTSDGGQSWTERYVNPHPEGFFCAMAFWDSLNGLAVSDPVGGRFAFIKTMDGGETWREMRPSALPAAMPGEYAFAASGTCLSVGDSGRVWLGSGGAVARVFFSSDSGWNWRASSTPMIGGTPSQGIFSLLFFDKRYGIAVGGDYTQPGDSGATIIASSDGGATWQLLPESARMGYRSAVKTIKINQIQLLIAVGRAGSSASGDGGLSWQHIPDQSFYTLDASPRGELILAAGANGRVSRIEVFPQPTDHNQQPLR